MGERKGWRVESVRCEFDDLVETVMLGFCSSVQSAMVLFSDQAAGPIEESLRQDGRVQ